MRLTRLGEAVGVERLESAGDVGCGIVAGAIWCWGESYWAGTPPVSDRDLFGWVGLSPGLVDDAHDYIDVAASGPSVCGLDAQQEVRCSSVFVQQMVSVSGLPPIRRIVGSGDGWPGDYCGLAVSDSTPWCWEVGGTPAQVTGSPGFVNVWMEGGGVNADLTQCGLRADSTASCWGVGPLGNGSADPSDVPVSVSGGHRFAELAVGWRFACGRKAVGEVWCWGKNGQTGQTTPDDLLVPALATTGASRIAAGMNLAQAMVPSTMVRWEYARFDGVSSPTGLSDVPVAAFAINNLSCVHLVDGQVYCYDEMWNNSSGIHFDNYSPVQPVRRFP